MLLRTRNWLDRGSRDPWARPVVVVETDPAVRVYRAAKLEHLGFRVVATATLGEAHERLGGAPAELAGMDWASARDDRLAVAA